MGNQLEDTGILTTVTRRLKAWGINWKTQELDRSRLISNGFQKPSLEYGPESVKYRKNYFSA